MRLRLTSVKFYCSSTPSLWGHFEEVEPLGYGWYKYIFRDRPLKIAPAHVSDLLPLFPGPLPNERPVAEEATLP